MLYDSRWQRATGQVRFTSIRKDIEASGVCPNAFPIPKIVTFNSPRTRMTTTDHARELLHLCRTGRLHDVANWIADGRPLEIPHAKKTLAAAGAVWSPDDKSTLNGLRRALYECEPAVTIELLQVFLKYNACPAQQIQELLHTPRMKEHLASQIWHLSRLGLKFEDKQSRKPQPPPAR